MTPLPPTRGRRERFLPYARQEVTDADVRAVVEVLGSDYLTTGPTVGRFEEAFAEVVGARHAVAFSSGTAALHAAVVAAGVGPGTEAITTPLTFAATANAVLYAGGRVRFADIDPATLTLDPTRAEEAITPATRAILPVDYAGLPADPARFMALAADRELVVIEDACHAPGARAAGKPVGSIAHITCFSFHPVKHLTTGEGGMATTDDAELARRMRTFRNHGIDLDARARAAQRTFTYDMGSLGYNYRLSDIGAALGLSQLSRLAENIAARRALAARYRERLAKLTALRVPACPAGLDHAYHLFPALLQPGPAVPARDDLLWALRERNIGGNVHYPPVHLHSYYRETFGHRVGEFPHAEEAAARLMSLPMFHAMSLADVDDVCDALEALLSAP